MTQIYFDPIPNFTGAMAMSDGVTTIAVEYANGYCIKKLDLKTKMPITTMSIELGIPIHRIARKNGKIGMFCNAIDCEHGGVNVGGANTMERIKRGLFRAVPNNDKAVRAAALKVEAKKKRIKRAIANS
jgi:hypothetical protein